MTSNVKTVAEGAVPASSVRWALIALSMSMLISSLGTSIANVGLPTLEVAFNATFQEVQWIVLAYLLAITAFGVGAGRLGDIVGRRRLLLAGLTLFTTASAVSGIASTLWVLIAARAVQGIGAATMMALTVALVGEAVPKEKTGSAMGLLGTMSAVGTALGPSAGGFLIVAFGWQALFLVNVPLGIVTLVMAYQTLPVSSAAKANGNKFDSIGTGLLAFTIIAYALAMTIGRGQFGTMNWVALGVAAFGIALFIVTQKRSSSPLIQFSMLRDQALSSSLTSSFLVTSIMMATLVVGPFYMSRALGFDTAAVGMLLAVGPVVVALTGIPAGRIVDRFGAQTVAVIGLVGVGLGCSLLAALPTSTGILGYIGSIVIVTAGYAAFQTANNTGVMANVDREQRGVISGLLTLSRNLGLVTGASVMGAVFAAASVNGDVAIGMRVTFGVGAVMAFIGLIAKAPVRIVHIPRD